MTPPDDPATEADNWELMRFEVPVQGVTPEQRAGITCIWCLAPLHDGSGIDLGGVHSFRPHACQACRTSRLAALKTFFDWLGHATNCAQCVDGRQCGKAEGVRRAHLAARLQAGKGAVLCEDCGQQVVLRKERVKPTAWSGESALHIGYTHVGSCPRPSALASAVRH